MKIKRPSTKKRLKTWMAPHLPYQWNDPGSTRRIWAPRRVQRSDTVLWPGDKTSWTTHSNHSHNWYIRLDSSYPDWRIRLCTDRNFCLCKKALRCTAGVLAVLPTKFSHSFNTRAGFLSHMLQSANPECTYRSFIKKNPCFPYLWRCLCTRILQCRRCRTPEQHCQNHRSKACTHDHQNHWVQSSRSCTGHKTRPPHCLCICNLLKTEMHVIRSQRFLTKPTFVRTLDLWMLWSRQALRLFQFSSFKNIPHSTKNCQWDISDVEEGI